MDSIDTGYRALDILASLAICVTGFLLCCIPSHWKFIKSNARMNQSSILYASWAMHDDAWFMVVSKFARLITGLVALGIFFQLSKLGQTEQQRIIFTCFPLAIGYGTYLFFQGKRVLKESAQAPPPV